MAEPVLVQALIAKASVETRHVATFLPRPSGLNRVPVAALLVGRLIHRPTHELGSVVAGDLARQPAPARYRIGRMSKLPDLSAYPLCAYFLSGYLQKGADPENSPGNQITPKSSAAMRPFSKTQWTYSASPKRRSKKRTEFNFDSGYPQNLEGGIAILRAVVLLNRSGFTKIVLVNPPEE